MPFVPLIAMGTLVFTLINFLRDLSGGLWSSVTTQGIAWIAGVLVVQLVARTQFADGIVIGDMALSRLSFWSLFFVGLMASSIMGTINEVKKALDGSDSATHPKLLE